MEFKLKSLKNVINISKIANIHYFEFTRQYHTLKDKHAFCELIYVDSGKINVEADNYTGALLTNQAIIHKAGETHSLSCLEDEAPNVIIIGFECKSNSLDRFSTEPTTLSRECIRLLTDTIKEGRNVFLPPYDVPNIYDMKKRKDYPYGSEQMLRLKLEAFFIELIRSVESTAIELPSDISDTKVADVYLYINENFRENINLSELCFMYRTNKTTLCHSFKKAYGETIIRYINRLKIKETKKLLREGKYSLTEIANIVGVSSVHYLSRLFKSYEGKSPNDYMKTIKSKLEA